MSLAVIHRLNEFRVWADRRLLTVARQLPEGALDRCFQIGHGSLRGTLRHLQAGEEVWLARLARRRNLQLSDVPEIRDLDELTTAWDHCDARWAEFLRHLHEEELDKIVTGTTSRGAPFRMPLADCLLHLYTAQAYHYAQANHMLRELGVAPLDLSLAFMSRGEYGISSFGT